MAREQDRKLTDAERAEYDRSLEEFKKHKREQLDEYMENLTNE